MERRVLLAITLSFLVLFLFQRFVMPPPAPVPAAPAGTPNQNASPSTAAPATATPGTAAPGTTAPPAPSAPQAPAIAATVSEVNTREIVVETTKVRAVFSNHGAKLVHWVLKEYRTDAGQPLDLVPGGAGADA